MASILNFGVVFTLFACLLGPSGAFRKYGMLGREILLKHHKRIHFRYSPFEWKQSRSSQSTLITNSETAAPLFSALFFAIPTDSKWKQNIYVDSKQRSQLLRATKLLGSDGKSADRQRGWHRRRKVCFGEGKSQGSQNCRPGQRRGKLRVVSNF